MNAAGRRAFFWRALLVAWSMVTLVLLFCVVLLVVEMIRGGQDPLELVKETIPQEASTPVESAGPVSTREITLYFAGPGARKLVPETRRIDCGDYTVDNCRNVLDALIQGPLQPGRTPILPSEVKVRALYLLDSGELAIDFSIELQILHRRLKSTSLEALMVHGIANTLAQTAVKGGREVAVKAVRILIEGQEPGEQFPAHIDVSAPIAPDLSWLAAGPEPD